MKAFVSFAQKDHDLMHMLSGALIEYGITAIVAAEEMSPGVRIDEKVEALISQSDCVIVLSTPLSSRSRWVQQEIGYARASGKHIIPLKTRGAKLGAMLDGYEYFEFRVSDPYPDFLRVAEYLRKYAKDHVIAVGKLNSEINSKEFLVLHLPHPVKCPECGKVEVHVFLCFLCGDWVCTVCGASIPPSSRVSERKTRASKNRRT